MDLYTREIVGFNVSRFHNTELILGALNNALSKTCKLPKFHHSDQGSEYNSQQYTDILEKLKIKISMSNKSSPWENGHQESFYSGFKLDLGDVNRFDELGELIESIYKKIDYYNTNRIHTALKMSPKQFRKKCQKLKVNTDSLFRKRGT